MASFPAGKAAGSATSMDGRTAGTQDVDVKAAGADDSNDGIFNDSAMRGQTIIRAYGKDASNLKGEMDVEQSYNHMKNTGLSKSMKI